MCIICVQDPVLRNQENLEKGYKYEDNIYYNILQHYTQADRNKSDGTSPSAEQLKIVPTPDGQYGNKMHVFFGGHSLKIHSGSLFCCRRKRECLP